jgi:hypothetical protein
LDLYVHFCNTDLFRKSAINRGIIFYNKVPDYFKKSDKDSIEKKVEILSVTTGIVFSG